MSMSEFQETVADFKRLECNLRLLERRRKLRNFLRIIGIGFFLYKNVESEISRTRTERQAILGVIAQKTFEQLAYFRKESENILKSDSYLAKSDEIRLINLLDEFDNNIEYLSLQSGFSARPPNIRGAIGEIRALVANYNVEFEKRKLRAELLALKDEVLQAVAEFDSLFFEDYYFSKKQFHDWECKWLQLKTNVQECVRRVGFDVDFQAELYRLLEVYRSEVNLVENRNRQFVEREATAYKDFFNKVESNPLTSEQTKAILTDEVNVLVVAGAGTGKTSTIVGKAGYLLKKGLAKPNEILLLSFNTNVREELDRRIKSKLHMELDVKTYHSFGRWVIAQATNVAPTVSELAEDKTQFTERVSEFLKERMKEPSFARTVNEYFLYHLIPYKSQFEFNSFGEYIRYLKQYDLRSLKGDRVKSLEECYIANFLFINGIDYLYEADYEVRTANENYRQYKPDFFLPKYKIYIEHFGINREGKPAPFIQQDAYIQQINWKRSLHRQHQTKFIETFSYEQREGTLLTNLEKKLKEKGVVFLPIPQDQVFAKLNSLGKTGQFPILLCNFINLYKASGKNVQQIQSEADPKDMRTAVFLKIFSAIYEDYTSLLKKAEQIDFNDMLNDATTYIKERKYVSNFKYILVDEFQDISQSRYQFLKALANQNESKLFCVGDDWQSIYRFTGSDISLMADFQKGFNFSETMFLQETFRFNNKMCDFSTNFILQNPLQIRKNITSRTTNDKPAVTIIRGKTDKVVKDTVLSLSQRSEKAESVFIIGRYNYLEDECLSHLPRSTGNLRVEYTTAHRSKGLEADYVIVVGLNGGKLGFPCQIADDPVLNLVLAKKELYSNAEERRLFYVAITRAKKHVFLIDDPELNSSSFTVEILNGTYDVEAIGQVPKTDLCLVCGTGELVQKQSAHGLF